MEEKTSLFLVPTPIGNLGDITLRALEVLKSVDVILAEDTRTSGVLLKHYSIDKPLQSFHIFNEHKTLTGLVERMKKGEVLALISDAGTPGISDPGFLLVREALRNDLKVDCLPGATALIPALVKSGFPTDRFVFEGFLPHKKGKQTLLKKLAEEDRTVIFYESPHRLVKTLEQVKEFFGGERLASVSRELSKKFEETKTGSVEELASYFGSKEVKGEIVVVVAGKTKQKHNTDPDV
ncbi:MAG TPA: 16S rRNA (cytidine(1402)-2'-O)-methyltransferase [Cyclobacteriaceae bacterium]|nr:16S rRNA (cytidine(1402)-2'-O)-methyltransferase [Cyclobacteriaceae bacterium]HMV88438.1 16S rRNA (cytidine(1402)-2'-O)-methyltransferase [Cyclobacteriaceae bacterium]HMX02128.1 16S rRNA (cytidine(1402)-2'-O)-methyltransferase [Cyclobacteriaceae bacterium]HMX49896.1 16S rRNA (cytidine(1402)-2'-O)-methyltransferase [Cyclobacteriaceae bacterium]HMY93865.1 16S rRNA (cytidine(1402)-2'-O)-methyltransferase [Cyclobacteriaceae bacterium]